MTRPYALSAFAAFMITGMIGLAAAPHAAQAQDASGATSPDDPQIDYGVGPEPDNYGLPGSEGTAGDSLYGGGAPAADPSTPEGRAAAAAEVKKRHDAMIKRMKENGDKIIQQSKKRAWELAHPGKTYDPATVDEEKSEADLMDEGTTDTDDGSITTDDAGGNGDDGGTGDDSGMDGGDDGSGDDGQGGQ